MATKQIIMRTVCLLFLPALLMTAFGHDGTLQEIPDDKVYTDIQKTLINGTWGVLTCRFTGPPYAVFWKKGHDPFTAPTLMTWTPDGKTGPRYEDGTCDMDENYSLVIKIVNYIDAGRYICLVSNQHGVLIDNYTDVSVSDIALETKPTLSAQMGQTGVLPCQVNIRPKKVSWMRSPDIILVTMDLIRNVIERGGPGYDEGLFNITKEYSLVINDVMIQHEGRYLCEVIDFDTDNLYRDVTMLTVFAQPREPFPIIERCPTDDHTNCIITTDSSVTLTCNVNEYYPDINLFFVHGSEMAESTETKTLNNTDGTKNKSVAISADISHNVYKCMTTDIPGMDPSHQIFSSVRLIEKEGSSVIFTVILVPIAVCLSVVLLAWMRLRKRSRSLSAPKEGSNMEGIGLCAVKEGNNMEDGSQGASKAENYMNEHISDVELWKLVEYTIENKERRKLDDVLIFLNGTERPKVVMDEDYYFQELYRWKDTEKINQRTKLYDECREADLGDCLKKLEEFRKSTSTDVPTYDLEHILWQIGEPQKIKEFLQSLGVIMQGETKLPMNKLNKSFIQAAVAQLVSWTKSYLPFNPVVILSFTLEKLGHRREHNNFFQISAKEKNEVSDLEVERYARDLSRKHCEKLKDIGIDLENMDKNDASIMSENKEALFDIEKMLHDWLEYTECSNYDKRCALNGVCKEFPEIPENDHWLSDQEVKVIARYLDHESMRTVCSTLGIFPLAEDTEADQRFEVLCQWRLSMSEREWTSVYCQLRSALEEVGVIGVLPPLRSDPVNTADCVDIAYDLFITDVLPVARGLGINVNKLAAYRPKFEPSHLEKGTIHVVAKTVASVKKGSTRLELCSYFGKAGFPLAIAKNILAGCMGYGELHAISDAMSNGNSRQGIECTSDEAKQPEERQRLLSGNDETSVEMTKAAKDENGSIGHFNEIRNMLRLTNGELAVHQSCENSNEQLDEFTMFRIWKERPRLAVSNERAAIIQGLFDLQKDDIARAVAEGKYNAREVSFPFINYIVKKMDKDEIERFAKSFDLKKEIKKANDSDDVTSLIHDFLRTWRSKSGMAKTKKFRDLVALTDSLVDNGFLDIARELIVVESQNIRSQQ